MDLGEETYFYNMQLASDGNIFVCGLAYVTYPNSVVLLMKFRADGTPDPGVRHERVVATAIGSGEAEAQKMLIQRDGKLVLAGRAGLGGSSDGCCCGIATTANSTTPSAVMAGWSPTRSRRGRPVQRCGGAEGRVDRGRWSGQSERRLQDHVGQGQQRRDI